MKNGNYVLKGASIVGETQSYDKGFLKVEDGIITEVTEQEIETHRHDKSIDLSGCYVVPGFIDVHIHGSHGADTMDASQICLETIAKSIVREGTTGFLATTITQGQGRIEQALANVAEYAKEPHNEGAQLLGVHLEGPFISAKRAGAQPVEHILEPNLSLFNRWYEISGRTIKLVTLAPETEQGLQLVGALRSRQIIASIGHSDAVHEQMMDAISHGANHVTHLYNGMRGFHHREPGVAGTALARNELTVELIVDGIHVHPEVVKATYDAKTADNIILITDAMRAKWLADGTYELGGQTVHVKNGKALLQDGTLAGSVLKMNDAIKNVMTYTGCSLEEAVQMASVNPAKQLNVFDRKGSIRVGKDADLTVLDQDWNVVLTMCQGRIVYQKGAKSYENH